MRYVVSDVHGEYELFESMLKRINFSANDTLYICGDIIDKGASSVKLAKCIFSFSNIHCVIGNHEFEFLKYYHTLLQTSPDNFDEVLKKLRDYFPEDGHLLDWDLIDFFESLPSYIEEDDFICVHAGIPVDSDQKLAPINEVSVEQLVYDRKFKDPNVIHKGSKCVFFGHTQTDCICGENKIIGYCRNSGTGAKSIKDFYKIHLDTGAWSNGVLGCFCIDTLKVFYVEKENR